MRNTIMAALGCLLLSSCIKTEPPANTQLIYKITVHNHFTPIQAKCAAFIADADGRVSVFRWIPALDSVELEIPIASPSDRFDCTVVRISTSLNQGQMDTSVLLQTYSRIRGGTEIHLRDNYYQQLTDVSLTFTGFNTFDTLVVPDGMSFEEPNASNGYKAIYKVRNTGKLWVRLKINGENNWRYASFEQSGTTPLVATLNTAQLPVLNTPVHTIQFPFLSNWTYKVDQMLDPSGLQLLPLGETIRVPGGLLPTWDKLGIQGVPDFPSNGYRILAHGAQSAGSPYTYYTDAIYPELPDALPIPDFDLGQNGSNSNRIASIQCSGVFGVLRFLRSNTGQPSIHWEATVQPKTGPVTLTLPDVPTELAALFPDLANYNFGPSISVRGESYSRSNAYEEALLPMLLNNDPLWQAKAGYVGREIILQ
ncbi:MAG: hypothetical protein IPL65_17930 [Lewinellaceae bacterium]|nr:hypothetical protein [Lewinellaceae bacterium]